MRGEASIQSSIVGYLNACAPQCKTFAIPNGELRNKAVAAKLKRMGVVPGAPDLILVGPGRVLVGFEVKTSTGRMSKAQESFAEHWRALGAVWAVVRSIDDVRNTLASVGIATREAA